MHEPWLLVEGADSDGRFIVKLNGRFRNARERVGLPTRLSLHLSGERVMREITNEQARGKLEDVFYKAAAEKGGALAATIFRIGARYTYLIHLPPRSTSGASPISIPEALRESVAVEVARDVEWGEYCSYLYARQEGPFERLRRWWDSLTKR